MKKEIQDSREAAQNDVKKINTNVSEIETELKKLEGGVNYITYDSYNILQSKLNSLKGEQQFLTKALPKEKIRAMEKTLEKMENFDEVVLDLTKSMNDKFNRAEAKVMDKKFSEYVSKNQLAELENTLDKFVKQPTIDTMQMDMI